MTYDAGIPNANDIISQSQPQIRTNFSQADTAFGVDHTAFSVATDQGKHKKSTYLRRLAAPGCAATELVLYEKLSGTSSELFFQRDAVATETQLTGGGITAAAWVRFTVAGAVVTVLNSFNVTSVTNTGANGPVTINFTRNFSGAKTYVAIVNALQNGTGDTTNRKINETSQVAASYTYNVTVTSNGSASELPEVHAVFFGTLA